MSYTAATLIFNILLISSSVITVVFWWKKSRTLRVCFIAACFFLFYYRHIEEPLLWNGSDLALRLVLIVQIVFGFCIYIALWMMLFIIVRSVFSVFLPKIKKNDSWYNFLSTVLVMILALFTTASSILETYSKPQIVTYQVHMGSDFLPFRIAVIADLHLRKYMSESIVARSVSTAMSMTPDLILLLGDNIDAPQQVIENLPVTKKLRDLHAPLGVYAVTGNNDLQWKITGKEALKFYDRLGIHLLEDEKITLPNGVDLIARNDRVAEPARKTLKQWNTVRDKSKLTIYLDHQPTEIHQHVAYGNRLLIAGHTHGGQFFPMSYFYDWFYSNPGGMYQEGDMVSIVSRGVGFSKAPIRLGVKPEIVIIEVIPVKE